MELIEAVKLAKQRRDHYPDSFGEYDQALIALLAFVERQHHSLKEIAQSKGAIGWIRASGIGAEARAAGIGEE